MNRKNLPRLRQRIARQHTHAAQHAATQLTPATTAAMGSMHPPAPQEMVMPMTVVQMTGDVHQVAEMVPLYAGPRGAPVPATAPGQWVQIHAAGRP
jgi:hypothetical protein